MKKSIAIIIAIAFLFCTNLFAQTNPSAQSLRKENLSFSIDFFVQDFEQLYNGSDK